MVTNIHNNNTLSIEYTFLPHFSAFKKLHVWKTDKNTKYTLRELKTSLFLFLTHQVTGTMPEAMLLDFHV